MTFPGVVFVVVAGATMALSGFLLFQVQPMMARYILPWFGGSATTWTVCMLFFQLNLLLGYFMRMSSPGRSNRARRPSCMSF
jgi:hypothetical protein